MANEMRDRLYDLMGECEKNYSAYYEEFIKRLDKAETQADFEKIYDGIIKKHDFFADHLIENGVTIIPCESFKNKADFVKIPCKCKECEHFNNYNPDRTYCEEHSDGWGDYIVYVDEDDYCSFGIRKEGGADNDS